MSGRQERRNRERGMGMRGCKRREAELRGRGGRDAEGEREGGEGSRERV